MTTPVRERPPKKSDGAVYGASDGAQTAGQPAGRDTELSCEAHKHAKAARTEWSGTVVLLSNAGFYLGKMLAEGRNTTAVVATLTALAARRVRDTGRQLAGR
ncbi:hypothetical protein Aduo_001555 [Ancylostoma duodenale]